MNKAGCQRGSHEIISGQNTRSILIRNWANECTVSDYTHLAEYFGYDKAM